MAVGLSRGPKGCHPRVQLTLFVRVHLSLSSGHPPSLCRRPTCTASRPAKATSSCALWTWMASQVRGVAHLLGDRHAATLCAVRRAVTRTARLVILSGAVGRSRRAGAAGTSYVHGRSGAVALRSTASQHDAPDNLLGWGIVDGVAAVDVEVPEPKPIPQGALVLFRRRPCCLDQVALWR